MGLAVLRAALFATCLLTLSGSAEASWTEEGRSPGATWVVSRGVVDGLPGRGCAVRRYDEKGRYLVSIAVAGAGQVHVSFRSGWGEDKRGEPGRGLLRIGALEAPIFLRLLDPMSGWRIFGGKVGEVDPSGRWRGASEALRALAQASSAAITFKDGSTVQIALMADPRQAKVLKRCVRGR